MKKVYNISLVIIGLTIGCSLYGSSSDEELDGMLSQITSTRSAMSDSIKKESRVQLPANETVKKDLNLSSEAFEEKLKSWDIQYVLGYLLQSVTENARNKKNTDATKKLGKKQEQKINQLIEFIRRIFQEDEHPFASAGTVEELSKTKCTISGYKALVGLLETCVQKDEEIVSDQSASQSTNSTAIQTAPPAPPAPPMPSAPLAAYAVQKKNSSGEPSTLCDQFGTVKLKKAVVKPKVVELKKDAGVDDDGEGILADENTLNEEKDEAAEASQNALMNDLAKALNRRRKSTSTKANSPSGASRSSTSENNADDWDHVNPDDYTTSIGGPVLKSAPARDTHVKPTGNQNTLPFGQHILKRATSTRELPQNSTKVLAPNEQKASDNSGATVSVTTPRTPRDTNDSKAPDSGRAVPTSSTASTSGIASEGRKLSPPPVVTTPVTTPREHTGSRITTSSSASTSEMATDEGRKLSPPSAAAAAVTSSRNSTGPVTSTSSTTSSSESNVGARKQPPAPVARRASIQPSDTSTSSTTPPVINGPATSSSSGSTPLGAKATVPRPLETTTSSTAPVVSDVPATSSSSTTSTSGSNVGARKQPPAPVARRASIQQPDASTSSTTPPVINGPATSSSSGSTTLGAQATTPRPLDTTTSSTAPLVSDGSTTSSSSITSNSVSNAGPRKLPSSAGAKITTQPPVVATSSATLPVSNASATSSSSTSSTSGSNAGPGKMSHPGVRKAPATASKPNGLGMSSGPQGNPADPSQASAAQGNGIGNNPPPKPPVNNPPQGTPPQGSGNNPKVNKEGLQMNRVLGVSAIVGLGAWAFKVYYWDPKYKQQRDISVTA